LVTCIFSRVQPNIVWSITIIIKNLMLVMKTGSCFTIIDIQLIDFTSVETLAVDHNILFLRQYRDN